ncbi:MAG: fumarylacetoacetate hydrolase family protein [Acidobacteriota bacterium]|nr:fumarylacetoacetate hydrolase family protein [Acidobacteriota bacterium]
MRFLTYSKDGVSGLALKKGADWVSLPGLHLLEVLRGGDEGLTSAAKAAARGSILDPSTLVYLPPIAAPPKIVCVGMNYKDHVNEAKRQPPTHPTYFGRFTQTLIGHGHPLIRPTVSDQFDYEGELVAVIGKTGRHISPDHALDYIAGYSIFNDASVRDYQRKGEQWTLGKNFDGSGAFGPEFVTADELPRGAKGLTLTTRLNGVSVQCASIDEMIFDIPTLLSSLSEAMTLVAGDVIVTGTPGGVGFARTPKLFMKSGDVCEVEIEGIGVLRNPVVDETPAHDSTEALADQVSKS